MCFFCQAEDGIRDLVRSRGLGDVYKRQQVLHRALEGPQEFGHRLGGGDLGLDDQFLAGKLGQHGACLLYTSDAADERSSVDLGGRRIIKKKKHNNASRTNRTDNQSRRKRMNLANTTVE